VVRAEAALARVEVAVDLARNDIAVHSTREDVVPLPHEYRRW
jgi:hypothetical protein